MLSKSPPEGSDRSFAGSDEKCSWISILNRGLLLFWGLWLALVVVTNLADGLKTLRVLSPSWPAASGNYAFMARVTAIYATPAWVTGVLFCGVIGWETIAALLFLRAAMRYEGSRGGWSTCVMRAFAVSLGLWMAFMVADELFLAYEIANTHRTIFIAQLLTLLVMRLRSD